MDLEMPVMDGLTCVCEIRSLQKAKKFRNGIPVFAVTANARIEQLRAAKEQGMVSPNYCFEHASFKLTRFQDDVVTKPFRVPELMDRMQRALR